MGIENFSPDARLRGRLIAIYVALLGGNIAAWIWALMAFQTHPMLLGTAFLAYSFGLRHAFDADHIAAIDNVTRKLVQDGQRPLGVGLFFSLGHSSIVFGLSIAIAATTAALHGGSGPLTSVGSIFGTLASCSFLFAIALANMLVLIGVYRTFQSVKRGGQLIEADLDQMLSQRGFFGRLFRSLFGLIRSSWQMYPVGLLFGLGFDTATEVGLLGLSASQASQGLPIWSILVFPALFTAGMTLLDTTDSILMLGAYGWAFIKPIRKLYYNMTITFVSVVAALAIGGIEALGLLSGKLGLKGPFWDAIGSLNDNFGVLGYVIVAIFIVSWLVSIVIYRLKRYDEIEIAAG